jgi:NADPH-dependent 2,4-dienoyl-CoA reductase/sulfur reductase-like enzyme
VVVGGGRAGLSAVAELRRQGFPGDVVVLSAEPDPPYHRPSCSKGILTGRYRPADVRLPLDGCPDVRWRFGRRAVGLDVAGRVVETDGGESYPYDGLVVATGSRAVAPADWPVGEPGIHVLYSLADAWALRRDLYGADRVAVVGGGLTGCEVAWAVRELARECVLVDSNPQLMTRALGEVAGSMVTDEVRRQGVEVVLGWRVRDIGRRRRGWRLTLDNGAAVDADLVVATTGERPDTGWLTSAGPLDLRNGVRCDENLRVVGADGVVAAGSIASWPNLRYGTRPRRYGQWIAAMELGRAAADTLLAEDRPVPPVTLLNRFWTDQFGLRIQASGELQPGAEVHVTQMRPGRRDIARAGVLVSYTVDGELSGLVAVNAPRAFNAVTRSLLVTPHLVPMTRTGRPHLVAVG